MKDALFKAQLKDWFTVRFCMVPLVPLSSERFGCFKRHQVALSFYSLPLIYCLASSCWSYGPQWIFSRLINKTELKLSSHEFSWLLQDL